VATERCLTNVAISANALSPVDSGASLSPVDWRVPESPRVGACRTVDIRLLETGRSETAVNVPQAESPFPLENLRDNGQLSVRLCGYVLTF